MLFIFEKKIPKGRKVNLRLLPKLSKYVSFSHLPYEELK